MLTLALVIVVAAAVAVLGATLSATISASVSWTYANALSGSITPTAAASFTYTKTITNGSGAAGTADLIYAVQTTLAGGANTTLDLVGSLADFFGTTISMARLKFIFIHLTTDTAASALTVGNATNPVSLFSAATTTISIRNGGIYLYGDSGATGIAMTGGASDGVKLLNADGSVTATIQFVAIGSSA